MAKAKKARKKKIKITPAIRLVQRARRHLRGRRRGASRSQLKQLNACIRELESASSFLLRSCRSGHSI